MPEFFKPKKDIDALLEWCFAAMNDRSHFPGMTYEEGVMATLDWLEGNGPRPDEE